MDWRAQPSVVCKKLVGYIVKWLRNYGNNTETMVHKCDQLRPAILPTVRQVRNGPKAVTCT